jgi:hydroxyacylglutathione hydrolase
MLLRRLFDDNLAQASYLVADEHQKVAMIVDPNLNIAQYIEAAAQEKVRITQVTETHIHADFLSGARELAAATGAQLLLSDCGTDDWKYRFAKEAGATMLHDGSTFMVGDIRVESIHTPGHTPEHLTFLLTDTASAEAPMGALTGDFIFVGDVGRPDLLERAAGQSGTMEAGARQLFKSIQKFKSRPDYLQLWPGHGAGSACGKALGAMPQTTLGYEKLFNWGLVEPDEKSFVKTVLEGQPDPPAYFATMKRINRDGRLSRPVTIPPRVSASDVTAAIRNGAVLVDTRHGTDFSGGHLETAINIPRNKSFLTYAGTVLPYDQQLFFIAAADADSRAQLANDLALIGISSVSGVLPVDELDQLGKPSSALHVGSMSIGEVANDGSTPILDVRSRAEYAEGHLAQAIHIPLGELASRMDEIPEGDIVVHCQGGTRSIIAASILQRGGRRGVMNMPGGFAEWERSGHPVERGARKTGD